MYCVTFGEDSTTLSRMCHFIDSVDITHTIYNFLRRTKLIYFFYRNIYIYIYRYIYIYVYIYIYIYIIYIIYIIYKHCFAFLLFLFCKLTHCFCGIFRSSNKLILEYLPGIEQSRIWYFQTIKTLRELDVSAICL